MRRKEPAHVDPPGRRPAPGFPCQTCSAKIQMTIEDLLYQSTFRCVVCGAEYQKNAQASAAALEMLQDVHIASKQLDEVRRDPLRRR
jgi:hypothetical protein